MPLTPRQQRFVDEYLLDLNASAAARRAGYQAKSAALIGMELLNKTIVAEAIQRAKRDRAERTQITQDMVLQELALLSQSDITHYIVTDTGDVRLHPGAPPHAMRAVASLKKRIIPTEHGLTYETEIRLWNKPSSVKMAGEHLGMWKAPEDPARAAVAEGLAALLDAAKPHQPPLAEA